MICEAWLSAAQFDAVVLVAEVRPSADAWRAVDAAMPCVWEPLAPHDAALLHRALAVRALGEGDEPAAVAHFRAVRRLTPAWAPAAPPPAWAASAAPIDAEEVLLRGPAGCDLRVDGVELRAAWGGEAAVVQCLDRDGHMVLTTTLDAKAVARAGGGAPLPTAREPQPPRGISARAKADPILVTTGGLLLGAAATMVALSAVWNGDYYDISRDLSPEELADLRGRTNGAWAGGILTGAAGAGLVGAGLLTVRW